MKYGKWGCYFSILLLWGTLSCEKEDGREPVIQPGEITDTAADDTEENQILREVSQRCRFGCQVKCVIRFDCRFEMKPSLLQDPEQVFGFCPEAVHPQMGRKRFVQAFLEYRKIRDDFFVYFKDRLHSD